MKVLITGTNGFVGRNLALHLSERKDVEVHCFSRSDDPAVVPAILRDVDFVFHLAGVNRPQDPSEFTTGNAGLTALLSDAIHAEFERSGRKIPIIFASSIQAERDNPYGKSKLAAEAVLRDVLQTRGLPVNIFRLPNVFGKWCKPNYNSAVATFCHNIARDLPIQIHDPNGPLSLVYIDDVVETFVRLMDGGHVQIDVGGYGVISPQYQTTVGEVAALLKSFRDSRATLLSERVGQGFVRALYSTYVSYLPVEAFSYTVPQYGDPRGVFVEMLKTPDAGQFSYFTAHPGITRGGHYHHSKTEKFLVIKGQARFRFRHMQTGVTHELTTTGDKPEIVETVPGWTHDITNIGEDEMIVMLWANEVFDRNRPDTIACPL